MSVTPKKPAKARSVGDLMLLMMSQQEHLYVTTRRGLRKLPAPPVKPPRVDPPRAPLR